LLTTRATTPNQFHPCSRTQEGEEKAVLRLSEIRSDDLVLMRLRAWPCGEARPFSLRKVPLGADKTN
jgi:hypothetical protein